MESITYNIPPIEDSFDEQEFESLERRYYTRYYYYSDIGHHQVILLHSNRVCLVCLAHEHPVVKDKKPILNLDFDVSKNINRLDNKVSGKGKKGGQAVDERATLCNIKCAGQESFQVKSCVRGKLIGINQDVVDRPDLISEKPLENGHIAIILPKLPEGLKDLKERLLTEKEFNDKLAV